MRTCCATAHAQRTSPDRAFFPPRSITHRCLSLPPQIGVHEGALECVHEREFAKFLFSLQSFVWRTQRGLIRAPAIPQTGCRRTSEVHRQHSPQPPPARPHTMVHLEKGFVSGPLCAASARAPLSTVPAWRVQTLLYKHAYICSPVSSE